MVCFSDDSANYAMECAVAVRSADASVNCAACCNGNVILCAYGQSLKDSKKVKAQQPTLFTPFTLRGITARNRIWMPPMDTYSAFALDGRPGNFHYQHYVSRAMGGFGLIIVEATAVTPDGRISPCDLGLWEDSQIDSYRWIAQGMKDAGAVPAIQLNHAGRKGSTSCFAIRTDSGYVSPELGGWQTVAPSELPFGDLPAPRQLTVDEIHDIVNRFRDAACARWRPVSR